MTPPNNRRNTFFVKQQQRRREELDTFKKDNAAPYSYDFRNTRNTSHLTREVTEKASRTQIDWQAHWKWNCKMLTLPHYRIRNIRLKNCLQKIRKRQTDLFHANELCTRPENAEEELRRPFCLYADFCMIPDSLLWSTYCGQAQHGGYGRHQQKLRPGMYNNSNSIMDQRIRQLASERHWLIIPLEWITVEEIRKTEEQFNMSTREAFRFCADWREEEWQKFLPHSFHRLRNNIDSEQQTFLQTLSDGNIGDLQNDNNSNNSDTSITKDNNSSSSCGNNTSNITSSANNSDSTVKPKKNDKHFTDRTTESNDRRFYPTTPPISTLDNSQAFPPETNLPKEPRQRYNTFYETKLSHIKSLNPAALENYLYGMSSSYRINLLQYISRYYKTDDKYYEVYKKLKNQPWADRQQYKTNSRDLGTKLFLNYRHRTLQRIPLRSILTQQTSLNLFPKDARKLFDDFTICNRLNLPFKRLACNYTDTAINPPKNSEECHCNTIQQRQKMNAELKVIENNGHYLILNPEYMVDHPTLKLLFTAGGTFRSEDSKHTLTDTINECLNDFLFRIFPKAGSNQQLQQQLDIWKHHILSKCMGSMSTGTTHQRITSDEGWQSELKSLKEAWIVEMPDKAPQNLILLCPKLFKHTLNEEVNNTVHYEDTHRTIEDIITNCYQETKSKKQITSFPYLYLIPNEYHR